MMKPAFLVPLGVTLALGSLALTSVVAGSERQASAAAAGGISYGARTPQGETLWIRLRPDRRRIANLELSWEGRAARCTHRQTYYSSTFAGGENGYVIPVRAGQFRKRFTDRFFEGATAISEDFQIQGRISRSQAVGQFTVKVTARRGDGTGYRCNVGPVPFKAVN
jgi:hypothetical protein